ncbi:1-acyl-sn-glycerol-3-phosphate acyltransferase [Paenalkalicoccus suaedae]|uniref:1-acyl-sn-glycerol-3-phosphate acyltransferase n=1 Tax=Paenalkalicoccus suaedae TaxID=2592382 RepID=A0A859FB37_9BACI|nr:lysophospholipid acyltransferase family protein [Paenalkalicoccus suaedae]QKS70573.1 1-acyl-sn-glycerol-3-phosphate acyltransferase [Paenalkalicoccus suaedae]
MIRTTIWFIYFFLYLLVISPAIPKGRRLKESGDERADAFVQQKSSTWARRLIKLAGGRITVHGFDNIPNEPVLFVSNHQGNFDIPILLSSTGRKTGFISKVEVKKIPLIRSWMELLDCVFLDRKDRRQAVKAIRSGSDRLVAGASLVIFPEGTRSKGKPVQQFKKGSFKLATLSKVTIVPVSMNGTYRMMEANGGKMKPADASITFGEPIRIHQENPDMKLDELAEYVQQKVEENLDAKYVAPKEQVVEEVLS